MSGVTLGFSAAATPGPFQAYLLNQTVSNGWKRALPAVLAPLISDGPIILLVVIVLSKTPDWFLSGLKIGGGVFLLYLAYEAYHAYRRYSFDLHVDPALSRLNLIKAALINASGPGPYIFWSLIAGPILMEGWRKSPVMGIGFLIGFYSTLLGGFSGFVLLFALARRMGPTVNRALVGFSGLVLFFFGLSLIFQGVTSLT